MRKFGLVGYPLGHSFSKKYFTEKFKQMGLMDHSYDLFEMEDINSFLDLWKDDELVGVNVTVPHKQNVIPFLARLDASATKVGAVNVIKKEHDGLVGYNSDYYGFQESLKAFLNGSIIEQALVLGTGGASKAVCAALNDLSIPFQLVSRSKTKANLSYDDLMNQPEIVAQAKLLINTTPLGMHPKIEVCPKLPYDAIGSNHYLFDLVYNPAETQLMKEGALRGAMTLNGLEMLHLQADRAWEIWNN